MNRNAAMNHVERFKAVMNFQSVDRLPRIEMASWWDKTIQRWQTEGLPSNLKKVPEISQYLGLDPYVQHWFKSYAISEGEEPFSAAVQTLDDYRRFQHQFFPTYDFSFMAEYQRKRDSGDMVVWFTLEGFFWFPRLLFGIEPHLYAFYDQPELMHKINQDLADYHIRTLRQLFQICRPDFVVFAEDMSYNHGPMLSRAMFDEFLLPYYRQVIPLLQEYDVVPFVDTDGDVTEMVPWLLEAGFKGVAPLERQAGVDAISLREQFNDLIMIGHFDKMVMPLGEAAMRQEFDRLVPLMKSGGYIPSVDHQTPPGVSLDLYRCYLQLLKEYTEIGANMGKNKNT